MTIDSDMELNPQQQKRRAAFREFVDVHVVPRASAWDRDEFVPAETVYQLANAGYLGAVLPVGEGTCDMIEFGLLNEELGRGCSSIRSLLTVHSMVALSVWRWGTETQKVQWLEKLRQGQVIAAFALTEPEAGSDAHAIRTEAVASGDDFLLSGNKKWITFAQIADLFLVFARTQRGLCAFLVERNTPGLVVTPVHGMLGTRASMMGELRLEHCRVPKQNMIGAPGFGLSHIASSALDCGRYSVAWGCVGIAQTCLQSCLQYTGRRKQAGTLLRDHQLIQRMIAQMAVGVRAARSLCYNAGQLRNAGDPASMIETSIAKYFSCKTAAKAAQDAVQIHGANGCSGEYPVERFYRDAKIMEIIEGSNEIQEITIAQSAYEEVAESLTLAT
ncbi:MAG TPA: acyl-CoA dehydrogenase family protein [Verrucomicrobiae bacterium]|nr:acyl-CoA dehydrogenase family protein [Verrucomicrobiae bacterium]